MGSLKGNGSISKDLSLRDMGRVPWIYLVGSGSSSFSSMYNVQLRVEYYVQVEGKG